MKILLRIVLALLLFGQYANAQTAPPSHLAGEELRTWLRVNWYEGKRTVLDYGTARGRMYNYIDNYNNEVTCVYSGYKVSKPYNETATSTADVGRINCEHTVPQSWFDEAVRMRSDIHHLFPTYDTWNSDRGSDPFAEIPDNQTTKWVRGTSSQSSIPTTNIDEYSEDGPGKYEPREDHKGNLARAVFYFYTMHANERFDSGKNSITAVADINTLYQWHLKDPVDAREVERNNRVEKAQGNRNPYIDYPDLVASAWGFKQVTCEPATQVTNLVATDLTTTSLRLSWANGSGNSRLVVIREGAAVNFTPTGTYTGVNANYTLAAEKGNGHKVVHSAGGSGVTVTGLTANKTYYVQVFEYCASSEEYNTTNAPAVSATTPDYTCSGTPAVATAIAAANIMQTSFTLSWANGTGDGRIVVLRKGGPVAFVPADGTAYSGANANYTSANTLADGSKLVYAGTGTSIALTGLEPDATYYAQIFESCSNGQVYAVAGAPAYAVTTATAVTAPPVGDGSLVTMQTFNTTATDGWEVTSGFSKSDENTGYPSGQRLRSGASLQTSNTTNTVIFSDVNITGRQDVYLELYNSSVATTSGNGIENSDFFEVYVALNGADFGTTPEIRITGTTNANNIQYGMNGKAVIAATAGVPTEKIFTTTGLLGVEDAPSILRVSIPNGTSSVKAKLVIMTNSEKETWNIDDVGLYAAAPAVDCDENPLEGIAGEDKTVCASMATAVGTAAAADYTYTWAPATGLSDATAANPNVTLTVPGIYTYRVTATNGTCTYEDDVTVTVTAVPAKPSIAQDATQLTASIAGAAYEWFKDDERLVGETAQSITISKPGFYKVRVKNEQDCFSEYSEALQVTLQPNAVAVDAAKAGVVISPNPTTGQVVLHTQQALKQVQVIIVNALGQVIYSKETGILVGQQAIDLSHLPVGLYLVHIKADKLQVVQRLVLAK
ncbi:endonuclease [uncultured Pontibacter sp.]|uniref:endonuclease n=1 Tax=uncultured Pontibacter sp. TaxID=453356 RepID=UPI0026388394|nr:endonuclease [uncultured Pontibacter sp.]